MEAAERKKTRRGRFEHQGGLGVVSAAVVLAVVVAGAGAAGFVVLSALGANHSSTSSVHQCSPPGLPQCSGAKNATSQAVPSAGAAGLDPR